MSLILDAGALIAIERGDRFVLSLLKRELAASQAPITHGGVMGQAWRGGSGKQARLARFMPGIRVVPLDAALGRRAGVLLGRAHKSDVIDAAVVLLANDGDWILTSDLVDLEPLVLAAGLQLELVPV